jgi:hypothetical protein
MWLVKNRGDADVLYRLTREQLAYDMVYKPGVYGGKGARDKEDPNHRKPFKELVAAAPVLMSRVFWFVVSNKENTGYRKYAKCGDVVKEE